MNTHTHIRSVSQPKREKRRGEGSWSVGRAAGSDDFSEKRGAFHLIVADRNVHGRRALKSEEERVGAVGDQKLRSRHMTLPASGVESGKGGVRNVIDISAELNQTLNSIVMTVLSSDYQWSAALRLG